MQPPEPQSPTEALDLQNKIADTLAGKRPFDNRYPYFPPDYDVPFLHIGTERQLFLDNFILDHLENVERHFPKPERSAGPLVQGSELPWEKSASIFTAAALHDPEERKFKLWYCTSLGNDPFGDQGMIMCCAESTDCIHWEKPRYPDCIPHQDHSATNIVLEDSGHHITLARNHDQSDPARKYLLAHNPGGKAQAAGQGPLSTFSVSPDGRVWTTINEHTPYRHHHFQRPIWDASIQQWISYSQYSHHWNFLHQKRQIGRQTSDNFINWSPKEVVLSGDWDPNLPPHVEYHDLSVRKIGGLYIGILTEFAAEPQWCVREGHNWRDTAYAGLSLHASRDGKRWQRVGNAAEYWVPTGPPGTYDYGFVNNTVAGQLVHEGKTYIMYGARGEKQSWYGRPEQVSADLMPESVFARGQRERQALVDTLDTYPRYGQTIGALILREDGWAQLKPTYEQGAVITRQFVFEGNTLRLNAEAYGGYLRVELLDPHFKPYPGFSTDQCQPITAANPDQIWHTVSWKDNADLRTLWNKPVRLVIHLHQASLYAFQFSQSPD
ncbi:MAG: hypothetical protein GKR89_28160 [Candidatus Latescibacteria bacterium]|nr:hypothetical protein [Candidatus Latescibacterota bacterium]